MEGRDDGFDKGARELGRCRRRSFGGQGWGGDRGNGDLLGVGACEKGIRAMSDV